MLKNFLKKIRYLIEILIVRFALFFFCVIGVRASSNLASSLARFIGKKLKVHQLAYKNLSNALPELSEKKKGEILDDMWDNLGRIVGEFHHIGTTPLEKIEEFVNFSAESKANLEMIKSLGKGGIIISAHIGNWEVGPKIFLKHGLNVSTVYRPLNNPYVETITANLRGVELIEKGTAGSRKIVETIKAGGFVVIMADQKISEGEPVKFFHANAITATSVARIALKYDIPIIPARSIRHGRQCSFTATMEKPLAMQRSDNLNFDILHLTRQINIKLESWIREYPSQWFWVHDRWK
jgi:KDO2-lipid IV(A) lauroyltransferase